MRSPPTGRLELHVQPRAAVSAVVGRYGDAIKVRVAAPPVDDAANDELVRFLAERLRVPRAAVTIASGRTSRRKTVAVEGLDAGELERRLLGC